MQVNLAKAITSQLITFMYLEELYYNSGKAGIEGR